MQVDTLELPVPDRYVNIDSSFNGTTKVSKYIDYSSFSISVDIRVFKCRCTFFGNWKKENAVIFNGSINVELWGIEFKPERF